MMKSILGIGCAFYSSLLLACMAGKNPSKPMRPWVRAKTYNSNPFQLGSAKPLSLEAKLYNLLLEYKQQGDVVLSFPANINKSHFNPFGDGQTNSKMTMGDHWDKNDFIAVGMQMHTESGLERKYLFHDSLNVKKYSEKKISDYEFYVSPEGWGDGFVFSFHAGVLNVLDLENGVPDKFRKFSNNRLAPNLLKLQKGKAYESLSKGNLGEGFNKEPWYADNVHARFPDAKGEVTAVGGVYTWGIVDATFGPFKMLQTCFEPRNKNKEIEFGVPSGAGWHHIGDPAETILNNLENDSLPVALAWSHGQKSAYGLKDVVVATWLKTDQAFVVIKGQAHWYANPYEKPVCTEIWVHKCVPNATNSLGMNCP